MISKLWLRRFVGVAAVLVLGLVWLGGGAAAGPLSPSSDVANINGTALNDTITFTAGSSPGSFVVQVIGSLTVHASDIKHLQINVARAATRWS